ncbi:MAG TPA: imidazole glycerol phosphate synthase cyclase subunit [Chitinophagaceae bacterium]
MLKIRVIPILTFNGFGLVKTKQFSNPRMVGNPVQAARVYNFRGVDELIFIDLNATKQKRKLNLAIAKDIIKECFMPVGIGGGIDAIEDINNLLKIGADKVVIKNQAFTNPGFIKEAAHFFGSQCITIAVDAKKHLQGYKIHNELGLDIVLEDFIREMEDLGAGELVINSVDNDGMMKGFDIELISIAEKITTLPIIAVGGGGDMNHYKELFTKTGVEAVGSASIFHFTQYTPLDIKKELYSIGKPVRIPY